MAKAKQFTLTQEQIADSQALARVHRARFRDAAKAMIDYAQENEIEEFVAMVSVASECLSLAAFMYGGTRLSFVEMAKRAFDEAEIRRDGVND
jgi:hypothetical protein